MTSNADFIEEVRRSLEAALQRDREAQQIAKAAAEGKATYKDASEYASKVGTHAGEALWDKLTAEYSDGKLPEEDAKQLIPSVLRQSHGHVTDITEDVQEAMNKDIGVGLKPYVPAFDTDRAEGIASSLAGKGDFTEYEESFKLQTENFTRAIVDESVRGNAEQHERVGLQVKVIREYDGVGLHNGEDVCEWCESRAGEWTYREATDVGAFQRHTGCGCDIYYHSEKGWQQQTDWTSNQWVELGGAESNSKEVTEKESLYTSYKNTVRMDVLDAPGYKEKFQGITGIEEVDNAIYENTKLILDHRKGTNFEDLYLIDANTGDLIYKLTTCDEKDGVSYNDETYAAIDKAHNEGRDILALHNHPGGLPPTLFDGVSALKHGYTKGVAVGHNLEVYTYGKTDKEYSNEKCNEVHDAMNDKFKYGIVFEEEDWYDVLKAFGMEAGRIWQRQ